MSSRGLRRLPTINALSWEDCRLLIDSVQDYAIFMLDPSGRVASWNTGAERIKGYKADEIIGQHVSKFYPQEDIEAGKPERELSTAAQFGRVEDDGWRVRKDGTRFWANVIITAMRDENGNLRGFGKVTRDLSRRREADERLRVSERRFHELVDAVTDYAIFLLDPTGHVATWNAGAKRTKGYEESEIVGKHFSVFYTPEDRANGKPERILETVRREGRVEDESWRVRKDGTRFWANVVLTALRDDRGNVTGFAKVTRDLTERRAAEERLLQSEERFRVLVEGVRDYAIYLLDVDGRVSTWNLGAERMTGYRSDEIIGRTFETFFAEDDRAAGKPARELDIARAEGRFEDEVWRVRKDGTRFWANVVLTALRDPRGKALGFAKVTRDLTARREAEQKERMLLREQAARAAAQENEHRLRESEERAREAARRAEEAALRAENANRVKDEFLATVSHELRTPLNAILGWSTLIHARPADAATARGIEVIHRNAQAQSRIVEDILDMSRIITGKLRLDLKQASLVAIVRDAIDVVRPSAAAKQIAIAFETRCDGAILVADSERLGQVAWNLLSNAVKFTEAGGSISVRVEQDGPRLTLSVRDTGRGIDPEFLPYVFDRFKQADGSTTRRFGGLGLGLSIVRHIVELHGGSVQADSAGKGQGAIFTVTLPIRALMPDEARADAEVRPSSVASPSEPASLNGVRVLVVDDDADARELLRNVLVLAGAEIETAASALAGFEAVRAFRPHVLISDIGMPDEDGYSFMRRVHALDATSGGSIPSIALTAYTRSEDRTKALAAGFTTHVGKPVNPVDLVAAVANLAAFSRR
jgi:PAS domain S-box-containing protein